MVGEAVEVGGEGVVVMRWWVVVMEKRGYVCRERIERREYVFVERERERESKRL